MSRTPEWIVTGLAFALSSVLWNLRGRVPSAGDVVSLTLSVQPSDRGQLDCAFPRSFGKYRCGYTEPNVGSVPPPASKDRLAPFVAVDRAVYLLPDLFSQPKVENYLELHVANRRFNVHCRVRLLEQIEGVQLRFSSSAPFGRADAPAWVAEPLECVPE